MSKHTKGPWLMDKYENVVDVSGRSILFRGMATLCSGSDGRLAEAKANTLLASCAPELLEALEAICLMQARNYGDATQTHLDLPELVVKARTAIAKARGEA